MSKDASEAWSVVAALFDRLVELSPPQRESELERAVVDEAVRTRVRRLFQALEAQPGFLETPAVAVTAAETAGYASLPPGSRVGAFAVERLIARGGMGEVYLAQRIDGDFHQQVALKLLRPETAGRLASFENERRILAGLEHPGIARLIDGGLAPDGRPWMAMEYVDGIDIVTWADTHRLGLGERLELFREVCAAVDFAHRNLVVHRDLKPANILVTGAGSSKLLDFGIARLADDGSQGAHTQLLFTPDYAAPEQLEGGPITMATDVYALGLLLHELLTGVSPWRRGGTLPSRLTRRAGDEPPPASQSVAAEAPVPARQVRGDLDAIVAKALRAEPAQRYQSAAGLWADVERHQRRDPVLARGDARGYRFRRFVGRHRVGVAATAAVFVALSAGLVGTAWQARKAANERDQVRVEVARADAVKNYLLLMFRTAGESGGADTTAKQVLDQSARRLAQQYRDDPHARAELVETLGNLYLFMNDSEGARPLLRDFLDSPDAAASPAVRAEIQQQLAEVEMLGGNIADARRLLDSAQAFWGADPEKYRKSLLGSRQTQSRIEKEEAGYPQAIRTLQAALLEHDAYYGRTDLETANVLNSLGIAYQANGDIDRADAAFRDSWDVHSALANTRSAAALLTLGNWATVAFRKGDLAAAEQRLRDASAMRRELYGTSAALAAMQANLGKIMVRAGKSDEATPLLRDALAMSQEFTGGQSPLTVAVLQSLTEARLRSGDSAGASAYLAQAREAAQAHSGEDGVFYAICDGLDARLHAAAGDVPGALALAGTMAAKVDALGDAGAPYQPEVEKLKAELAAR